MITNLDEMLAICLAVLFRRERPWWYTRYANGDSERQRVRHAHIRGWRITIRTHENLRGGRRNVYSVEVILRQDATNAEILRLFYGGRTREWSVHSLHERWLSSHQHFPAVQRLKELGRRLDIWASLRRTRSPPSPAWQGEVADVFDPQARQVSHV